MPVGNEKEAKLPMHEDKTTDIIKSPVDIYMLTNLFWRMRRITGWKDHPLVGAL